MLGLLAFVKTPDAQVRLDLDNELEEAFFATKEQVKSMLCSQNDQQAMASYGMATQSRT